MVSTRASQRAFLGVSALLFAASAAATIVWCIGDSMGSAWMRMPGQTWAGAATSFVGKWVVMMLAMMLPSLVPMLRRYRESVGSTGESHLGLLTAIVGTGYFLVWAAFGMMAFPLGAGLATVQRQQPALAHAAPIAVGVVLLIAGSYQLTPWKARHLACCRKAPDPSRKLAGEVGTAWQQGVWLGLQCSQCCVGLMAVLLVIGVMDLRAMVVIAAAITVERLASSGGGAARVIGIVGVGAGMLLVIRATGLG